jgi:hypothetical protein
MPLPSTGTLSIADIAFNQGANSVGIVTPYSLRKLSILAGKTSTPNTISSFYTYAGYGYKYGSPNILHDYGLSSRYSTSSSNIIDTSGNGRTGVYVSGTGNGSLLNIPSGYYDTGFPAKIRTHDSNQYSIRLEDTAKYGGTASFTWLTWFRCTSFQTNFPGLISCEGRSGGGNPIGQSLYLSNSSGIRLSYVRWDGTSGNASVAEISFGASGVPAFQYNQWYMAAVRYDGSVATLHLYFNSGNMISMVSAGTSVTTSASWSVFNGLRYNNWLDGHFGYTAIYSTDIGWSALSEIFTNTKTRYGY